MPAVANQNGFGQLCDDLDGQADKRDGARLAVVGCQIDIITFKNGRLELLEFEEKWADFEVGVLRIKSTLKRGQAAAERGKRQLEFAAD